MDGIFGIGIPEILIVVVLALIILGPQDMVKTARKLGAWVYRVYHSPTWRMIMSTSQEIRELPTKFVREAGLEETVKDIRHTTDDVKAQLKEASGDVSAGLKDVTEGTTSELQEARQELKVETGAGAGSLAQPEPSDPAPALDNPAPVSLVDPDGDGNKETLSPAQPEPFVPRREQNSKPEEFTI